MDAREVTMHYKHKGDRVDEVLHDIVLNHVNRLEHENKRLREALEYYAHKPLYQTCSSFDVWKYDILKDAGYIARKALAGD